MQYVCRWMSVLITLKIFRRLRNRFQGCVTSVCPDLTAVKHSNCCSDTVFQYSFVTDVEPLKHELTNINRPISPTIPTQSQANAQINSGQYYFKHLLLYHICTQNDVAFTNCYVMAMTEKVFINLHYFTMLLPAVITCIIGHATSAIDCLLQQRVNCEQPEQPSACNVYSSKVDL